MLISVHCEPDYYTSQCDTYCVIDPSPGAVYKYCDPETGQPVCDRGRHSFVIIYLCRIECTCIEVLIKKFKALDGAWQVVRWDCVLLRNINICGALGGSFNVC